MNILNLTSEELIEERFNQVTAVAQESLTIASEALGAVYKKGYTPPGKSVALEDHNEKQGLLQKITEKVKAFWKWIKDLVQRIVDYFRDNTSKKEEVSKKLSDFVKKEGGQEKVPLPEHNVATEDLAPPVADFSSDLKTLRFVRDNFTSRKKALWIATNEICAQRVGYAVLFSMKDRDINAFKDTVALLSDNALRQVDDLFKGLDRAKTIVERTDIINEHYADMRRLTMNVFNSEDPQTGASKFLADLQTRIRFQQASHEDLLTMIDHNLKIGMKVQETATSTIVQLKTALDKFNMLELIKRAERPVEVIEEKDLADYYQAIGLLQKILTCMISTLRIFAYQFCLPESYFKLIMSTMNAYESVKTSLNELSKRKSTLDSDARSLFDRMSKEFS